MLPHLVKFSDGPFELVFISFYLQKLLLFFNLSKRVSRDKEHVKITEWISVRLAFDIYVI